MAVRGSSRVRFAVWTLVLALGAAASGLLAQGQGSGARPEDHAAVVIHTDHGPNSAQAMKAHYVVLVSLDGFRWDYAKKYGAAHLLALGKQGV